MSERRNTSLPTSVMSSERRQAERAASITDPQYPATGTTRIAALLAAAREREHEARRAQALATARRQPPVAG
ncbi:MAG: hypothetical protein RIB98_02525 [Acidimicrobiales bacterium]